MNPFASEEDKLRNLVTLIRVFQAVTVVFAWLLNPVSQSSQTEYALLLSANLVAFAVVSYVGRVGGRGERIRGSLVLAGCGTALLFMLLVLLP